MLQRRFEYPNTPGLILRRTLTKLYESHIAKMFEEYPALREYWREQKKELKLPNGSRLVFGSAEHASDLGNFYSAEYADIAADESQEFAQGELEELSGSNRCTTNANILCKTIHSFMPGISESGVPPKGLPYLKRVYVDRQLRGNEAKANWQFVQAFGWDNIEWAKKELAELGVGEVEFYSWDEERRREFFINHTDYGRNINSLSNKYLRDAWLYGKWDVFQGQYFPNFDYHTHTKEPAQFDLKPWYKRWISGDWGHDHPACFHWFAEDEKGHIFTYREMHVREMGEDEMGRTIGELTQGEKLSAFIFSADAFARLDKHTRKPITQMIGDALPKGFPKPRPADQSAGSRISGWRLMHQLLDSGRWTISRDCPKLIECLPTLVRDMERNSEDVLKVDWSENYIGDDPADSCRYGLQNMLIAAPKPKLVIKTELMESYVDKLAAIRNARATL